MLSLLLCYFDQSGSDSIFSCIVNCCGDPDPSVRKFACFTLGNAAFHSAALYPLLKPCVETIAKLLRDSDNRTRSNAAGALGNLVRNSGELCNELIRSGVLELLLEVREMVWKPPPPRKKEKKGR